MDNTIGESSIAKNNDNIIELHKAFYFRLV